jgi:hypothetical protein
LLVAGPLERWWMVDGSLELRLEPRKAEKRKGSRFEFESINQQPETEIGVNLNLNLNQ